jgi:hypothetical protein
MEQKTRLDPMHCSIQDRTTLVRAIRYLLAWAGVRMPGHFLTFAACGTASDSPRRRAYSAYCCFVPPRTLRVDPCDAQR